MHAVFLAHEIDRAEQRDQVDAEGEDAFGEPEPQIDRDTAASHRRSGSRSAPRPAASANSATPEISVMAASAKTKAAATHALPEPVQQRDQKPAAQPDDEDVQRMQEARYHFDSVKASIESVFFES